MSHGRIWVDDSFCWLPSIGRPTLAPDLLNTEIIERFRSKPFRCINCTLHSVRLLRTLCSAGKSVSNSSASSAAVDVSDGECASEDVSVSIRSIQMLIKVPKHKQESSTTC